MFWRILMDPTCIFCRIIAGDVAAQILYEDKHVIAFLDKRPLFLGHCLIVPKKHVNTLYDLPPSLVKPLFMTAQKIGRAVQKAMKAEGSFVAINNKVSQSVPHLHVHLIPRNFKDGLRGFFWPRNDYENEKHAEAIQSAIKEFILD